MTLREVGQSLWQRLRAGAVASDEGAYTSRMDGGITGYHPAPRKRFGTSRMQPVQDPVTPDFSYPEQGAYPQEEAQAAGYTVPYQTTRQAAGQGAPGAGFGTSKMQFRAAAPQAHFFGVPNAQPGQTYQPQQPGFQPQAAYQPQQTGFQPQQTAYQPQQGAQQPYRQSPYPPQPQTQLQWNSTETGPQPGYTPPQSAPADNVRYMPGMVVGEGGQGYAATLRIAQLSSVRDCYRLIEFMRNLESVIINVEYISDAQENQRCLDLLYGAAFAMQYTLTKISERSIYLISPQTMLVIPYETIRYASDQDMDERWPGAAPEPDRGRPLGGGFGHDRSRLSQRRQSDAFQRSRRGY